jgi:hypothetical protein
MSGLVNVTVSAIDELTVAFAALDVVLREAMGRPPKHYNPPPMFGLRESWATTGERKP